MTRVGLDDDIVWPHRCVPVVMQQHEIPADTAWDGEAGVDIFFDSEEEDDLEHNDQQSNTNRMDPRPQSKLSSPRHSISAGMQLSLTFGVLRISTFMFLVNGVLFVVDAGMLTVSLYQWAIIVVPQVCKKLR